MDLSTQKPFFYYYSQVQQATQVQPFPRQVGMPTIMGWIEITQPTQRKAGKCGDVTKSYRQGASDGTRKARGDVGGVKVEPIIRNVGRLLLTPFLRI